MATKTFEELKQLAIQIRDEKTNKANTATRIGTQMIEHLNKLEQEYYNKDGVAEQLKTRDDELARLDKMTTEYNVSVLHPTSGSGGSNKYTLETAIAQVPTKYRSIGLKCSFVNESGKGECWEYKGTSWSTSNFKQVGAGAIDEVSASVADISNKQGIYNVDANIPLSTGYYSAATARVAVPSALRKLGLIITYKTDATTSVTEQFIGSAVSAWATEANWKNVGSEGGYKILTWVTDAAITRKQVPNKDRKEGLQISYKDEKGVWIIEQYIGTSFVDTAWGKDENWSSILNEKDPIKIIDRAFRKLLEVTEETQEYNKDVLTPGMVTCSNVGVVFSENPNFSGYSYKVFEISNCAIINVNTKGGTGSARGIAFADINKKVIETANVGIIDKDNYIAPPTAKFILVNCADDYLDSFSVKLYIYKSDVLDTEIGPLIDYVNSIRKDLAFVSDKSNTLKEGYYYKLTTDIAPEEPIVMVDWWCGVYQVYKNDKIILSTLGGLNGRAYALADTEKSIYNVAPPGADYTKNKLSIAVEKDGFLYVNCTTQEAFKLFSLVIEKDDLSLIPRKIMELEEAIKSTEVKPDTKNISSLYIKHNQENYLGLNEIGQTKILSVSNSYGLDAMYYIPKINSNLKLGICYKSGASLVGHYDNRENSVNTYYYSEDSELKKEENKSLKEILSKEIWDYIIFQQASAFSGKKETYEPYLTYLIDYVKEACPNATILFNMTQPYAIGYSELSNYNNSQDEMYDGIIDSVRQVFYKHGIMIIPTGIAVQLARQTELNQYGAYGSQLSVDGTHLDGGIGRLLASYTWLAFFGIKFIDSAFYPSPITTDRFVEVTRDMADIAKKCAIKAQNKMYDLLAE